MLYNRDTSVPASRNDQTRGIKPSDTSFAEERLVNYQCIYIGFDKKEFVRLYDGMVERLKKWSERHFKTNKAIRLYKGNNVKKVLRTIYTTPMCELLKGRDNVGFIMKESCQIIMLLDHFLCDGGVLFDFIRSICDLCVDLPPFPKYRYIPFVSDALTLEYSYRNGMNCFKYPSQINQCQPRIETFTKKITKEAFNGKWNRWNNYAECILNIFERFEGNDEALGDAFYTLDSCRTFLKHQIPAYLHILITVGINTNVAFGNNRIGGIIVTVKRPDEHLHRNYRRQYIAEHFEKECTKNVSDAVTSYDLLRGFDTTLLREFGSNNIDVILTSFKMPLLHKESFGGFLGSYEKPMMYINSMTGDVSSIISYSTNWF